MFNQVLPSYLPWLCGPLTRDGGFNLLVKEGSFDEALDLVLREVCFLMAPIWTELTPQVRCRD